MRHFIALCLLFSVHLATAQSDYYIRFPDDVITTTCNPDWNTTEPELFNTNGANITMEYTNNPVDIPGPDFCYEIDRRWLIKSANYDPLLPCISVPNPSPMTFPNHPNNFPGPIVSPSGTPAPWTPTFSRLTPTDPAPTDFSTFWSATANCYSYTQKIKISDAIPPTIISCPTGTLTFADTTTNDPNLWNAAYWLDPFNNNNHDLKDREVLLLTQAFDDCGGANLSVQYLLFLDLNQDGVMETVVNSNDLPAAGQVNYGNGSNPGYTGGTPQDFDQRLVSGDLKYRFGRERRVDYPSGSTTPIVTNIVGWHTEQDPNTWLQPQLPTGTHKIKWIIRDDCGNQTVCEYSFTILTLSDFRVLRGKLQLDDNLNCQAEETEPAVAQNWKVKLDHLNSDGSILASQYSSINADYEYYFLARAGNYRLSAIPPITYFGACFDTLLNITTVNETSEINFPIQSTVDCPFLETDIGTPVLRRCFDNIYTVRYCNTGTAPADNAFIRVKLDPFMSFVSSQIPGIFEGNQTWRFDIGEIPVNNTGSFTLVAHVDCDSTTLGQTHCVEAHIYPDSICLVPSNWSGANIAVEGACFADSVRFLLRNTGIATTSLLNYIVIEDNIITRKGNFQLLPEGTMPINVPSNGSTWRVQAQQEPGNPYNLLPSATVEACGQNPAGDVSIGFVSQYGESDGDPFISIDCQASIGSYDPNDKHGYPLGYGDDHLIEPNQPLDYLIRFQNTGTDIATTVVVRDTLAAWLDPASVVPGVSSHPYRFTLSETGLLTFRFDNIFLPDSNLSEVASHGFVKFRVREREALPLGTVITNRAGIYFDFNAPVMTNETRHQIGQEFVTTGTQDGGLSSKTQSIRISPNPATNGTTLRFENLSVSMGRFELYDARGQFVWSRSITGDQATLESPNLPTGMYFFKVFERGKMQGVGKLNIMARF